MASITETARAFFDAVETGKGWAAASAYCTPDATFAASSALSAAPLSPVTRARIEAATASL